MPMIPWKEVMSALVFLAPEAVKLRDKLTRRAESQSRSVRESSEELKKQLAEMQEADLEQSKIAAQLAEETKQLAVGLRILSSRFTFILIGVLVSVLLSLVCLLVVVFGR